ncbi:MAG: hypothetical protein ACE5FB_03045 [Candidatus Binatia bacterium]
MDRFVSEWLGSAARVRSGKIAEAWQGTDRSGSTGALGSARKSGVGSVLDRQHWRGLVRRGRGMDGFGMERKGSNGAADSVRLG